MAESTWPRPTALLFDLDGTLVDTAPDMLGTLDDLRAELGLPARDLWGLRAHVSRGALPLLDDGLPELGRAVRLSLRDRYLAVYAARIARHSRVFPGLLPMLEQAQIQRIPWGVITNKPFGLAKSLLNTLGLRPGVLLGGDSLPEKKPHPLPVLTALETLRAPACDAWMIGDDARDIEAGRSAGCRTVACGYGYFDPAGGPAMWQADRMVEAPEQLAQLLEDALR